MDGHASAVAAGTTSTRNTPRAGVAGTAFVAEGTAGSDGLATGITLGDGAPVAIEPAQPDAATRERSRAASRNRIVTSELVPLSMVPACTTGGNQASDLFRRS